MNPNYNELFNLTILKILSNSYTIKFGNYKNGKYIDSKFNKPVDNLPNSITNLTFGNSFDKPVDNLPNSIQNLTFCSSFNQQVDNLPNSTISLTFGGNFNQQIMNLPNTKNVINCAKLCQFEPTIYSHL